MTGSFSRVRDGIPASWLGELANAPVLILALTLVNGATGLAVWVHWHLSADDHALTWFFRYPDVLFTLLVCTLEVGFCREVWRQFEPGDSLRSGWFWLSLSAIAHLAGRALSAPGLDQIWIDSGRNLHEMGLVLGGPVQMALLLLGLIQVARHCGRLGILGGLTRGDYVLLMVVGGFALRTIFAIAQYLAAGKQVTWIMTLSWTSDPLLLMLLAVAVVIRRSMANLGHGLLANCWRSYVIAIALTSVGSASSWCFKCSNTPWWTELGWFVWFLADAAYAMAPAFQVAALDRIRARGHVLRLIGAR